MKRTLLIGVTLTLAAAGIAAPITIVWQAAKEPPPSDRVLILKTKVLRLRTPTQGYEPYSPRDVVLISGSAQTIDRDAQDVGDIKLDSRP
jgi:hypothetical protein